MFLTALLAYALALWLFFPGYLALPVPYHPDMYWSVNLVAGGLHFGSFLSWPRPLFYEMLFVAGHFGLVGSLLFLDAIVLLDLALAVVLLERVILHRTIPWLIVLGTLLFAMVGPGFYSQPGFDVGFHIALLCGLLGVYVLELQLQDHLVAALCLTGLLFVLSALANEGLLPALAIYGTVSAFRNRRSPAIAAALAALPLLAVAAAFGDSQLTHSPFVAMNATGAYPYRIDLAPSSVLHCALFYLSSLLNAGFLVLLAAIGFGLWLQRRLKVGAILTVAALSLYLPYCVLPNHLDVTYQWVPMPLLMLLVPLAWVRSGNGPARGLKIDIIARTALGLALLFAIGFQSTQGIDQKHWYEISLNQNRSVIADLHSIEPRISAAHSIIVCGLGFGRWPFMESAAFLSHALNFHGSWTVATEPGYPPIGNQVNARPIDYAQIRWGDYDLIIIFDRDGHLAGAYTSKEFRARVARLGLERLSNRGLVDLLELYYPPGIVPPKSWAAGARQGLYLDTAPDLCCFLSGSSSLVLEKPAGAREVVFTFDVPHTVPFAGRPERVAVSFNGVAAGPPVTLNAGVHEVRFALAPPLAKSARITATMRMSVAYVPKQIGMNDDTRLLSIKLLRVNYPRV